MDLTNIENDLDINVSNKNYSDEYFYNNPLELELINKIIDISNNVFEILGKGFVESIYHKAILVDLYELNYVIETKKIIPIEYNGVNVGFVESDIIIHDTNNNITVIVELKSQEKDLNHKEILQVQKYMRNIDKKSIGLVINFPQKMNGELKVQTKIAYPF